MDGSLLYILIALVAALFVLGVIFLIQGFTDDDKRKLSQRLTAGEDRVDANAVSRRSIIMQQMESAGLPPGLAKIPALQALHRRLIQAYPDLSLPRFLLI